MDANPGLWDSRSICVVADGFDRARGGAETVAAELQAELTSLGFVVHTLEPAESVRKGRRSRVLAAEVAAVQARGEPVVSLCKAPGDIVVPQGGVHSAALGGAARAHHPVVGAVVRGTRLLAPRQWSFLWSEQQQAQRAKLWVALSDHVRDDMVAFLGLDPMRIAVVSPGVDLAYMSPIEPAARSRQRLELGLDPIRPVVLVVSNNLRLRGLDRVLATRLTSALDQVQYVVVGRGGNRRRWARVARADHVHVVGWQADVRSYYRAADVLVHASAYDPCPLVVAEALACGVPVVVSSATGLARGLVGSPAVVRVADRSVGALAGAMTHVLSAGDALRWAARTAANQALAPAIASELAYLVERVVASWQVSA